ncbi:LLM class F420-dependent oxidoreductase [Nonomuraea jiangxiensis]|uniref:Probable F420-dependent oxidoreductase, Rv2161c family n=1 Tax=Nonomuraea jiangxiensis TaxID=633440 RepID=A0A1G9F512_9ACTN|nr:LLM class F420-dependent oxidoreductase [Nonomuraea jiangxiensis]SDK83333.1 probable F420-dependent oxidoreductase, Rv2161c family [Nonomuraea jiangxiensis]
MQIGVVFPQTEIGPDVGAVRAYGQAVEELGYRHVMAFDHVLGADPAVHEGWEGPYDVRTTFHEPMVLFGYLAALTSLELVTSVIILPQRQTALVAKQAAEVDLLSAGRFRLGVGLGWNQVEYEALGQDFGTRGKRVEEQVELMRRLWTEQTVTFDGAFDQVTGAGLAPLPVQRPIPVWFGAQSPAAYRRAGRLADGWFPQMSPGPRLAEAKAMVEEAAARAGRDPAALGMEGRASWRGSAEEVSELAGQWREAGATHLALNTMKAGLGSVDEHLAALESAAEALGLRQG